MIFSLKSSCARYIFTTNTLTPNNVYINDMFNEYWNLLNRTLDVVVHELANDVKTNLENLNFQIVDNSIMMHFCCLETSLHVHVIHVIL